MSSVTATLISDEVQREQAVDPSRSVIVEAPAGSGKTSLLVQRFLRLLGLVNRPESIVAITFTRKAAAEMRERVLTVLEAAEQDAPLNGDHERRTRRLAEHALRNSRDLGWDLLSNSGRLQVQTIDSLCNMLVRQMPITSGFGGMANVAGDAEELYRIAARRALRGLTEGDHTDQALFRRLALYFDNNIARLERQVIRSLGKRDQWRIQSGDLDHQLANDFCELHQHACKALSSVFREQGAVDFCEITNAAIAALGTPEQPTDLLYWLDYRIEHLLVDEFQDTSRRQYRLLQALTEQWSDGDGHTLFLVGDPMQSIYRFREADVSVFLKCYAERQLGSVKLTPVRLHANFRSTPEVVNWTRKIFAPIMSEDDPVRGAIKLRPIEAARLPGPSAPQVIALVGDDGIREAEIIADIARRAPVKRDVAILVRSRSQVAAILPVLRQAGIAYQAVDFDCLKDEQHILDLVSLTRALLHLGDRTSWLACLRAPWCGLTVNDLSKLAEGEWDRTIFDLLSDPEKIGTLSPDGRFRAVRVQEILSAALDQVGRLPLRAVVEKTWLALGGPAVLTNGNHSDDIDTFLTLIDDCEEGGLIRDFTLFDERLQSLWARPAREEDAVQILTIHNAKGLEFTTVILPKLAAKTQPPDRDPLIWTEQTGADGETELLVAAKPQSGVSEEAYQEVCKCLDEQEAHELKRLFYVAVTRAKDELYLLGNANVTKKGELGAIPKNTFLGLIWDAVKPQFEQQLRLMPQVQDAEDPRMLSSGTVLRRLPANWRPPILERSVQWRPAYHQTIASSQGLAYRWASDTGRHVGTVVHTFLNQIAADELLTWNMDRVAGAESTVRKELARLGVKRSEQERAAHQVMNCLRSAVASDRGRWVLSAHAEARSEWAIQGVVGDKFVSGIVDRAFRDEDGRFWIVDFKTSEHQGGDLQEFLDLEHRRYRPQLETYAALVSRLTGGPIRLGLYFLLLDEWREWAYEGGAVAAGDQYTQE